MQIQDFIDTIEEWSPPSQAEDFDNVGLLVGDAALSLKGVLITLDTTEEIVKEAIEKKLEKNAVKYPINLSKGNAQKYNQRGD